MSIAKQNDHQQNTRCLVLAASNNRGALVWWGTRVGCFFGPITRGEAFLLVVGDTIILIECIGWVGTWVGCQEQSQVIKRQWTRSSSNCWIKRFLRVLFCHCQQLL